MKSKILKFLEDKLFNRSKFFVLTNPFWWVLLLIAFLIIGLFVVAEWIGRSGK